MQLPLCIYCGKRSGSTEDHVPPRSLFPKPRPSNLVKVPACRECNAGFSDDDEMLALFICLQAGMVGKWQSELHEKVKRAVQKNRRFQRILQQASPDIPVLAPDGSILEFVRLLSWTALPVKSSLERIVIGLAYHHYGIRVHESGYTKISIEPRETINCPEIVDVLQHCKFSSIGHEHEFEYRHGRATDSPFATVWEFVIYRAFHFVAFTIPLV